MSKRILLIDDDAVVLGLYRHALERHGFSTDSASDGIAGIQAMRTHRPDLVVLDLMMPKFSGVEVLKFMRGEAGLREIPVVLLSNSFMNDMAAQAVAVGVQHALLKVRCSPPYLVALINEVLTGRAGTTGPSQLLALPKLDAAPAPERVAAPMASAETAAGIADAANFTNSAHKELLANAPKIHADLRDLALDLSKSQNEVEVEMRAQNFYRRVHFLTTAAGMANAHDIALLSSAFEALLFEVMGRPTLLTPSAKRTIAFTTDFLGTLLGRVQNAAILPFSTPQVLVVDDDPLSNRLVTSALRRAQLTARATQDPLVGMQWIRENSFDLVLLDIEMPGMNGLDFCKQLRVLPGYRRTPVIFVTSHADFENRARSILSGGNDLISKPVLPIELAVKAVTQLLRANLDNPTAR